MELPRWVKAVAAFFGALLVGALGNGLWELIKEPLGHGFAATAGALTWGVDSITDDLYARIGGGSEEALLIKGMLALGLAVALLAFAWQSYRRARRNGTSKSWATLAFLAVATFFSIAGNRATFAYEKLHHVRQLARLAGPSLGTEGLLRLDSQIARVQSKAQYEAIRLDLESRLRRDNIPFRELP